MRLESSRTLLMHLILHENFAKIFLYLSSLSNTQIIINSFKTSIVSRVKTCLPLLYTLGKSLIYWKCKDIM